MKRLLPASLPEHQPLAEQHSDQRRFSRADVFLPICAAIWIVSVAFGLGFLMVYANRPGHQGLALQTWPENDLVQRSSSHPTLLVFAHPKCPCTRATMTDLAWLMTRCRDDVACHVLFFQAEGEADEWSQTDCWRKAESIAGVNVALDRNSRAASQFGVLTSGHALLYDEGGRLLFEGGITPSRGHPGDNPGRESLASLINGRAADVDPAAKTVDSTCVFGCPLHSPEVTARRSPTVEKG